MMAATAACTMAATAACTMAATATENMAANAVTVRFVGRGDVVAPLTDTAADLVAHVRRARSVEL